jgi:dipeptidyl aminopeptidase/acylaminoacyl peptidase
MKLLLIAPLLALVTLSIIGAEKSAAPVTQPSSVKPDLINFPRGEATLQGWIYKPSGSGPFPAVLYNHGSDQAPGWFPTLGAFWTSHGYVFFVPHRAGHGRSPGDYIVDLQRQFREKESDGTLAQKNDVALHEKANEDVAAAVAWLKKQPYVKPDAIVMSGISYGGIQTVLASEKELGVRAYIPFSPAAMSWRGNPLLRERLLLAITNAKAPVFLLQAKNDYNLGPTELLAPELARKGFPNRSRLYAAFGDPNNPADGHGGFAVRGADVWGPDVLAFLNDVMKK